MVMGVWAVFQELELLVHFRPVETTNSSTGPTEMSDRRPFNLKRLKTLPSDHADVAILWTWVLWRGMKSDYAWAHHHYLTSPHLQSPLSTFQTTLPPSHKYPWVPIFGEANLRLMLSLPHVAALWVKSFSAAISSSRCLAFWAVGKNKPGSVT